jgi:TonB family protein
MSKLAVLASLSLVACASTGATTLERDTSPRAKVKLDLSPVDLVDSAFPAAIEPTVPSVDRISNSVRAALGNKAVAELDLCVSPAGQVLTVEIARSSSYQPFDAALLKDAATWQFASLPGPDYMKSCRRTTIAYYVH